MGSLERRATPVDLDVGRRSRFGNLSGPGALGRGGAGTIPHAIRFTLPQSRAAVVPPASHWAANSTNSLAAPIGMHLRLKTIFDISSFSPRLQVILTAMRKYGLIMADNGSAVFISGAPDQPVGEQRTA